MKNKSIKQFNKKWQAHGYWERYYSDGTLWYKGNYIDGKPDGCWEEYWSNGILMNKGCYANGERTGYWRWYNIDGELEEQIFYK